MPRSNPSNSYISSSGPTYTPQVSPYERDDDTSSVVSHRDYDHDYAARQYDRDRERRTYGRGGDAYTRRDMEHTDLVDRDLHHHRSEDDRHLRERYREEARYYAQRGDNRDPRAGWLNDGMSRRTR